MFLFVIYSLSALFVPTLSKDCGKIVNVQKDTMPWVVNIYQSKGMGDPKLICAGTLISENVILTAASCFYDDSSKQLRKKAIFYVTADYKFKAWTSDGTSLQAQEILDGNIIKQEKYSGFSGYYAHNIAIAKLNGDMKIKGHEPACLYWDNEFTDAAFDLVLPTMNMVVWQLGKNATSTVIEANHVDYDECQYILKAKNVSKFLTYDKFCLRLKDMTVVPIVGSGVYAYNKSKNSWFLIGITSEITTADSNIYVTYTKLNAHMNWVANLA